MISSTLTSTGRIVYDPAALSIGVPGSRLYLPPGAGDLKAALPNAAASLTRARGGVHSIWNLCTDSTGVGYTTTYVGARKWSTHNVIAKTLRDLGLTVNLQNFMCNNGASLNGVTADQYDPRIIIDSGVGVAGLSSAGKDAFTNTANNTNGVSFQCDAPVNRCRVLYATNNTALSDLAVGINGGAAITTLTGNQPSAVRFSAEIDLGVAGLHVINIKKATASTASFFIIGLVAWNSADPGISLVNIGYAGMPSSAMNNQAAQWGLGYVHAAMGADLTIFGEQINDGLTGISVAARAASQAAAITLMKRSGAGDALMIRGPRSAEASVSLANQALYYQADLETVAASGVPLLDLLDVMGPNDGSVAANLVYADGVGHCTTLGYGMYGYGIGKALVDGLR